MDLGLKDKLIVVTGGGAGIGAGISRACIAEGARLVVLGRRSENVQAFMAEMASANADCHLVEAHLEDTDRCRQAISEIESRFGDIYGLVNNAGVNDGAGLEKGSVERFIQSLNKNARLAQAHAGSNRKYQFESGIDRPGKYFRLCSEQRCSTRTHARMGSRIVALQHTRECRAPR